MESGFSFFLFLSKPHALRQREKLPFIKVCIVVFIFMIVKDLKYFSKLCVLATHMWFKYQSV